MEKIGLSQFLKLMREIINERKAIRIFIGTYYKVRGFDNEVLQRGNFTLEIFSGSPQAPPDQDDIPQIVEKMREKIEKNIFLTLTPSGQIIFILYGGTGENFNSVARMIEEFDLMVKVLDVKPKLKFFILTCGCQIEEKEKATEAMRTLNRLTGLILGGCSGIEDLEIITKRLLQIAEEKQLKNFDY